MNVDNKHFSIHSRKMKSVIAGIVYICVEYMYIGVVNFFGCKSERFSSAINLDAEFSLEARIPLELVESSKFWWDYSPHGKGVRGWVLILVHQQCIVSAW